MATQYRVNSVDIDVDNNKVLIEAQDMDFLYTIDNMDQEFESPTEVFEFSGISQLRYLFKICQNNKQIRNRKAKTMADTFKALNGAYVLLPAQFKVSA